LRADGIEVNDVDLRFLSPLMQVPLHSWRVGQCSGAAARKNRGYIEFGLLLRAIFAMSNIEGALAKNQTAITASVMAHPAEEFERNGIIGAP
jgi:hypothetical protein